MAGGNIQDTSSSLSRLKLKVLCGVSTYVDILEIMAAIYIHTIGAF